MSQVLDLWRQTSRIPVLGTRAFSFAFGRKAPYFSTIRPRFTVLRPNYAELDAVAERLAALGYEVDLRERHTFAGFERFHTADGAGNRVEVLSSRPERQ